MMITVEFKKDDDKDNYPIKLVIGYLNQELTKKAACELQRKLSKAIHKMIEAE
jgi:hypothetical protein